MSEDARNRLIDFFSTPKDYLAGKSEDEKNTHLASTSYRDYLRVDAGLGDEAVKFFEGQTLDFFALGIDAVAAGDAMHKAMRGFDGPGTAGGGRGARANPTSTTSRMATHRSRASRAQPHP